MSSDKFIVWDNGKKIGEFDDFQTACQFVVDREVRASEAKFILRERKVKAESLYKGYVIAILIMLAMSIIKNLF